MAATSSSSSPLESLPDDLLIDVLDHLDRARDISHLEQASRRTRALVAQDGWRRFVRTRFGAAGGAHHYRPSSSSSSSSPAAEWRSAADRLTYLDRCWDRRAVVLINFGEKKQSQQRQRREPRNGAAPQATQQSVGFHPALDAGLLPAGEGELAAWGVGENLVTRVSAHGRPDEWRRLDGREGGYASGFGDVTAVSTLAYGERGQQEPAVAVGRANGELRIVRASGPRFGETLRTVARKSDDTPSAGGTGTPTRKSPAQVAVSWTDWHAPSNLLASSCNTTLSLHDLSRPADDREEEGESLQPVLVYDAALEDDPNDVSLIRNVRFASRDTLAVSLGGTRHPLRWGQITPTGFVLDPVPRSGAEDADFLATKADPDRGGRTTVRAVEPVPLSSSSSSSPLLLSAWDDGSYRLTDPRTPSPHDASYRDRWQPYEPGSTLLVYGTRHFVAGSNISPDLRFFDFRFPKSYHHADALPCSPSPPAPRPPFVPRAEECNDDGNDDDDNDDDDERGTTTATNNLKKKNRGDGGNPSACDHASGRRCAWHDLSRRPRWRPDATLHTGRSWRNRVHALTKASDASSRFYVGFEGAVTEVNLCLSRDVGSGSNDSLLERTHPEGWEAVPSKGRVGLIENGVGLVDEREWNRAPTENLEIWHQNQEAILRGTTTAAASAAAAATGTDGNLGSGGGGKEHSRLDEAYVPPPPRREGEVRRNQRGWRS
ncbi:hypothetical protein N3K66_004855 [Trichothecium roseum]|uniref:Uncharacterized protein n=1 Tax=Trichothecium roseum TaxID=47278 RepID=A0ACC0V2D7_9HYPO|nr:hypothetical protein N3K66_004855 [Trichothecium roseum]